jgi:hypothetical protein
LHYDFTETLLSDKKAELFTGWSNYINKYS